MGNKGTRSKENRTLGIANYLTFRKKEGRRESTPFVKNKDRKRGEQVVTLGIFLRYDSKREGKRRFARESVGRDECHRSEEGFKWGFEKKKIKPYRKRKKRVRRKFYLVERGKGEVSDPKERGGEEGKSICTLMMPKRGGRTGG